MTEARIVSSSRDRVGESPLWSPDEQALYWVDIEGRCIHRLDHRTGIQQSWPTPQRVGCIARVTGGGLLAAMETEIHHLALHAPPALRSRLVARIVHPRPNMRFNDGRCDHQGRLWVGTMSMDGTPAGPVGAWYRLDERGLSAPLIDGQYTPNGSAFSPDGRVFYRSDSHPSVQRIWAHDYDTGQGLPGPARTFIERLPAPGRPDGAAVDADGCYWICANDAGRVLRYSPQGQLLAGLEVPVPKPAMCAFGGPQLDRLFVTSIQPAGAPEGPHGAVFELSPGVCGLPEPCFSRFPAASS